MPHSVTTVCSELVLYYGKNGSHKKWNAGKISFSSNARERIIKMSKKQKKKKKIQLKKYKISTEIEIKMRKTFVRTGMLRLCHGNAVKIMSHKTEELQERNLLKVSHIVKVGVCWEQSCAWQDCRGAVWWQSGAMAQCGILNVIQVTAVLLNHLP